MGQRNSELSRYAATVLKRYGNTDTARKLFVERTEDCEQPLPREELNGIWRSALKLLSKVQADPGYIPPAEYNAPTEFQWEQPIPFDEVELPPFPVDALPGRVGPYVLAVAETTQTPPDMAASAALAIMASCLQGRYVVQAKPDWIEPVNIYVLIILDPAERKSAVVSLMLKPVNLYEIHIQNRRVCADLSAHPLSMQEERVGHRTRIVLR